MACCWAGAQWAGCLPGVCQALGPLTSTAETDSEDNLPVVFCAWEEEAGGLGRVKVPSGARQGEYTFE